MTEQKGTRWAGQVRVWPRKAFGFIFVTDSLRALSLNIDVDQLLFSIRKQNAISMGLLNLDSFNSVIFINHVLFI